MDPEPGNAWTQELGRAPRHAFVPDIAWTSKHGLIDRTTDAETWRDAVDTDIPIVTQIDDGTTELTDDAPRKTPVHSSSSSAPRFVIDFLTLLNPYPGDRVLEIGTGTGWTAALLSARLGEDRVTTIEVDPTIAEQATTHLHRAGFHPTVVTGDGAKGWPEHAPYDRMHVTCGVVTIPYAWIEQTRPGGIIALPWMHGALGGGHTLTLTVTGDGQATGRVHGRCAYMMLRDQREPICPIDSDARECEPDIDPRRIAYADDGLSLWLAGSLPGISISGGTHDPDGSFRVVTWDRSGNSHARVDYWPHNHHGHVAQRGDRDLWTEIQHAYCAWLDAGAPTTTRIGLTITPDERRMWIDHPTHRVGGTT